MTYVDILSTDVTTTTKEIIEERLKNKTAFVEPPHPFIGNLDQVPNYMIDNEYIWRGYRIGFNTHSKIIRSLFILHNESVNVWSHLIGAICFVLLILYTFTHMAPPHHDFAQEKTLFNIQGWFADSLFARNRDTATFGSMLNDSSADNGTFNIGEALLNPISQ